MKTEHLYVVCEHAKKEKRKLEERLKHEQTAPGEGGEEKKALTRSRLQGSLSSFGAERKEEWIDAHVRSLLLWRQEDKLMLACLENFIKQKARTSASGSGYLE